MLFLALMAGSPLLRPRPPLPILSTSPLSRTRQLLSLRALVLSSHLLQGHKATCVRRTIIHFYSRRVPALLLAWKQEIFMRLFGVLSLEVLNGVMK